MKKKVEKVTKPGAAKAAPKSRIKKEANVLLERTDKVVTRDKDTVLKIFGPTY
jgi:hypothetical protein